MVRFTHANLVNQRYFKHPFDLILCRNVLIYFTSDQIKLLENNLGEALKMDGWLMLSPAETLQNTRSRYTVHYVDGTLVYQKKWVPVDATPPQKPRPIAKSTKKTGPLSPVMANPVKSDDYYHQAVEAVRKNDSEIASQLAQQSLMAQQYLPQTHTLLASIYASQGDSAQALTHIQQALALDMFYADAHYLTALLHIEANNLAEARNALRSAIYCRPDFALAHFLSGNLFAQQGDTVRAKRAWTTARRVATSLLPHAPLSDIAEINAEDLIQLIDNHLAGLST
jgi:chemotaxis protein methyltransferase CheR